MFMYLLTSGFTRYLSYLKGFAKDFLPFLDSAPNEVQGSFALLLLLSFPLQSKEAYEHVIGKTGKQGDLLVPILLRLLNKKWLPDELPIKELVEKSIASRLNVDVLTKLQHYHLPDADIASIIRLVTPTENVSVMNS